MNEDSPRKLRIWKPAERGNCIKKGTRDNKVSRESERDSVLGVGGFDFVLKFYGKKIDVIFKQRNPVDCELGLGD